MPLFDKLKRERTCFGKKEKVKISDKYVREK
jgi:hypothetical protein